MIKLPDDMTVKEARGLGRVFDTELVHLTKAEVRALEDLTPGVPLQINPNTGEREAFLQFLLPMLPALFPSLGAGLASATGIGLLANPMVLGGLASGLGALAGGQGIKGALMSGITGGLMGGLGSKLFGAASAATPAAKTASEGAKALSAMAKAGDFYPGMSGLGQVAAQGIPSAAFETIKTMPQVAQGALSAGGSGLSKWALPALAGVAALSSGPQPLGPVKDGRKSVTQEEIDAVWGRQGRPRRINAPPSTYRPGLDPEWDYFLYEGDEGYAFGGLIPEIAGRLSDGGVGLGGMMGLAPALLDYNRPGSPQSRRMAQQAQFAPVAPAAPPLPQINQRGFIGEAIRRAMMNSPQSNDMGGRIAEHVRATTHPYARMLPMMYGPQASYAGGGMIKGPGDGSSDSVKARARGADGQRDIKLSDGEFVFPADVVAHLGNGSSEAGAARLQDMMAQVRAAKTGSPEMPPRI